MVTRKSSYYQSRYRARLRENGYVKREIWIPPDYTKILKDCETALRAGIMPIIPKTVTERKMSEDGNWTTETIYEALAVLWIMPPGMIHNTAIARPAAVTGE